MDIRQLNYFVVLARLTSFGRAAEQLNITQSTLSRSIQTLEQELGLQLFDRGPKGALLTEEGMFLIDRAENILMSFNNMRHDIKLWTKGELGTVRLGLGPAVSGAFMADLLKEIVIRFPKMKIQAKIGDMRELRESLMAGHIDFLVNTDKQLRYDPRVSSKPIGNLPVSLFVRAGHPLLNKKKLNAADISQYPLTTAYFADYSKITELLSASIGIVPEATVYSSDVSALKSIVKKTDAILLASLAIVIDEFHRGEVVQLPYPKSTYLMDVDILIAFLADRSLSPSAKLVIQIFQELFERMKSKISNCVGVRPESTHSG